jgi:small GTP-binding protein
LTFSNFFFVFSEAYTSIFWHDKKNRLSKIWHDRDLSKKMHSLKVVIVGDTKVGKSCILSRFVNGSFDHCSPSTIGAAFLTKVVTTNKGSMRLQLWDTAGLEKFRSLSPMYYRKASVVVLVFDVTSKSSFKNLEDWMVEIAGEAPQGIKLVVIGNKIDLVEERVISTQAGKEAAAAMNAVLYGETSGLTGEGVNEIFAKIAEFEKPASGEKEREESG